MKPSTRARAVYANVTAKLGSQRREKRLAAKRDAEREALERGSFKAGPEAPTLAEKRAAAKLGVPVADMLPGLVRYCENTMRTAEFCNCDPCVLTDAPRWKYEKKRKQEALRNA